MKAYLDNSATTPPTQAVIAAMTACMREGWHNPSSVYAPAVEAWGGGGGGPRGNNEKKGGPRREN